MTHDDALKTIAILKERNDLSLEEICKGFQIALALCDDLLVEFFRERYHQNLGAFIFDLALHIDEPKKIELFRQHYNEWKRINSHNATIILIAMIDKSKQCSLEADALVRELKTKHIVQYSFYEKQLLAFAEKSIDELMADYAEDLKERIVKSSLSNLYLKALESFDEIFLQEILEKAETLNDTDMVARLLRRLAFLKSNDSIVEALDMASSITFEDSRVGALYDIAKNIYAKAPESAHHIVSFLPAKFQYRFRAFVASSNNDLKEILMLIEEIEKLHKTGFISNDNYDDYLMGIAYILIDYDLDLVFNILPKLNIDWDEPFEIQIEIAIALSKRNLEEGIAYLLTIDEAWYQIFSIVGIIESMDDETALKRLSKLAEHYEDATHQYEILSAIHKKMTVPFQQLWSVTSKILPYEY